VNEKGGRKWCDSEYCSRENIGEAIATEHTPRPFPGIDRTQTVVPILLAFVSRVMGRAVVTRADDDDDGSHKIWPDVTAVVIVVHFVRWSFDVLLRTKRNHHGANRKGEEGYLVWLGTIASYSLLLYNICYDDTIHSDIRSNREEQRGETVVWEKRPNPDPYLSFKPVAGR